MVYRKFAPALIYVFLTIILFFGWIHRADAQTGGQVLTTTPKIVYLTFDADMTPHMRSKLLSGKVTKWYDPEIIAYLRYKKIPATIFSTGMFAELYPTEITDWSKSGFLIENHTYDHSAFAGPCFGLKVLHSDQEKKVEITKTQHILSKLIGQTPHLFRYPGLCHTAADDQLVDSLGLIINNGTLTSADAFNKSAKAVVKIVLDHIKNDSVVVMHLGGPNAPATGRALKKIIPELQARGFEFKLLKD